MQDREPGIRSNRAMRAKLNGFIRQESCRMAPVWALLAILSIAPGCTCSREGLDSSSSIAVTRASDSRTRVWTTSRAVVAGVPLGVVSFREGRHAWDIHYVQPDPSEHTVKRRSGVSAVSWDDASGIWHDRVFYVGTDAFIHEGGYDGDAFAWSGWSPPAADGAYFGPLASLAVQGGESAQLLVAAVQDVGSDELNLQILDASSGFTRLHDGSEILKTTSSVFGTVREGVPWFFTVGADGQLILYRPTAGPSSPWIARQIESDRVLVGDGAAAAWTDTDGGTWVSAVVRDGSKESGTVWDVRFANGDDSPIWTPIDEGSCERWSGTIAAASRDTPAIAPRGFDVAYVMDEQVRHRRFDAETKTWEWTGAVPSPPDITEAVTGPLAMAAAGWSAAPDDPDPRIFMVAQEVSNLGYAFVSRRGHEAWHNLLEPVVSSGQIAVNQDAFNDLHLTESAAHERGGTVVMAAMQIPNALGEKGDTTERIARIFAAWSFDDGHTWRDWQTFETDYAKLEEGKRWLQGDPTVALLSDERTAYVMFHEVRMTPMGNDCTASGYWACRSRITLYRGTADGMVEVPGPEDWEHVNPYLDSKTCKGEVDPNGYPLHAAFLDHPVIAVTSDDFAHFAWYEQWGDERDRLLYRVLDSDGNWLADTPTEIARASSQERPSPPYIVADATTAGTAFVAWDISLNTFGIVRCATLNGVTTCGTPSIAEDSSGDLHGQQVELRNPVTGITSLRAPWWTLVASPQDSGKLFIVYAIRNASDPMGMQRRLKVMASLNGGEDWSPPETIGPFDGSKRDRVAPTAAVLGDGTLVVTFYEIDPPGSNNARAMVVLRDPSGTWTGPTRRPLPLGVDLSRAPYKCGDLSGTRFVGDYHMFAGGLTHVHYMRADPLDIAAPAGVGCAGTCLWTAAVSETCY